MQKHAVPAGAEDHIHLAGGAVDGLQIDQGLAQGLVHLALPGFSRDPGLETGAAPGPRGAGLAPPVLFHGDLDIDPRQGTDIPHQTAISPQNLDHPALAGHGGRHLDDPRVAGPGEGVDFLEQGDLFRKARGGYRVVLAIEADVGRARPLGRDAAIAALGQLGRLRRPAQGRFADLAGMGVAGGLSGHHPQAEPLARIIGGCLEPAVVKDEGLALAVFEEQLAIIGAGYGLRQDAAGAVRIDAGGVQQGGGGGNKGHDPDLETNGPFVTRLWDNLRQIRPPGCVSPRS